MPNHTPSTLLLFVFVIKCSTIQSLLNFITNLKSSYFLRSGHCNPCSTYQLVEFNNIHPIGKSSNTLSNIKASYSKVDVSYGVSYEAEGDVNDDVFYDSLSIEGTASSLLDRNIKFLRSLRLSKNAVNIIITDPRIHATLDIEER